MTVIDPTSLQATGNRRFKPEIDMPDFSSEQELTVEANLPESNLAKNSGIMLSNQARSKKANIRVTPRQQKLASKNSQESRNADTVVTEGARLAVKSRNAYGSETVGEWENDGSDRRSTD